MKIQAYCGIDCTSCLLYQATLLDSEIQKLELAKNWGEKYKRTYSLEEMVCMGCLSDVVFSMCKTCDIKTCCQSKALVNCSKCNDYACDRLKQFQVTTLKNNPEIVFEEAWA